jgi:L-threonylcarbamoyladenylate synthase
VVHAEEITDVQTRLQKAGILAVRRVFVDPGAPQRDAIEEAAKWILNGGIVAIPTDTLYGLAADPFSARAVARLFAVKGRPATRAVPLVAADAAQIASTLGPLSGDAAQLAARFWPGPLTLLVAAPRTLAREVSSGTGRVGVRVPAHGVTRAICAAVGRPITATSANVSGVAATADPDEVERTLGDRVDLLIDTGTSPGGAPSTIVDATGARPVLIRDGATAWSDIQAWLHLADARQA